MKAKLSTWLKSIDLISKIILLLLVINLLRGVIYATVVPLWQAPDEPEHFTSIQIVVANFKPDSLAKLMEYSGRGFSLYDYLILPFYLLLSDKDPLMIAYLIRLISVALGTITVFLTYKIAKEIFPENLFIVLGAPIFVSFLPMFTHISSTIQPDNLANVTFAFFIYCSVRLIRKGINVWRLLGIAAAIIIALYTRQITFISLPLALLLPLFLIFRRQSSDRKNYLMRLGFLAAYLVPLFFSVKIIEIASSKFSEVSIDLNILTRMFRPSFLIQTTFAIFRPEHIFFRSFLAVFSWLNVSLTTFYYNAFFILSVISIAGLAVFIIKKVFNLKNELKEEKQRTQLLSLLFLLLTAFTASFSIYSFILLITPIRGAQGRWVFPAIAAIAVLFVTGFGIHFRPEKLKALLLAFLVNLFLFDLACLLGHIIPRFYQTISNFANPQSLYCGQHIPADRYLELTAKPGLLSNNYFYYVLFGLYFLAVVFLCWNIHRTDHERLKKMQNKKG